jgi:hypothetical protein
MNSRAKMVDSADQIMVVRQEVYDDIIAQFMIWLAFDSFLKD